jgi:altronate hydrolase
MGEEILEYCIKAASGEIIPKAVQLNQDDFIPWKRGFHYDQMFIGIKS